MRVQNTKFVCTLGPASDSKTILTKMIRAGMDVARLNFSHGSHEHHKMLVENVRHAAKKVGVPVAVMQDLQGPKIRVGNISDEGIEVKRNETIILSCGPIAKNKIPVQYKFLYKDVKKGDLILIDDGLIELKVQRKKGKDIYCKVLNHGVIHKKKGINVPDAEISTDPITPKDKKDLKFGLTQDIDYVALSFVKSAKDIKHLRKLLGNKNVKIVAKIERKQAVENLEEIIEESDALMVARGDLAMEVGAEKVPIIQKKMIHLCNLAGKPVITATQMLQSMTKNPNPTRAEVSDVANSIFDHTDAVMLSNESAVGKYPVRAVKMFAKVATSVEKEIKKHKELLPVRKFDKKNFLYDALGFQTCKLAETIKAKKIIVVTKTGFSALFVSKHHSYVPTIVITEDEKVKNQLALPWGLNITILGKVKEKTYEEDVKRIALKSGYMKKGEKVVIFYASGKEKHIVSTHI